MSATGPGKDPVRVAAGLRAAMHNPNVSEDARARAAERLRSDDLGSGDIRDTAETAQDQHTNRVLGGYKATLNNDNASAQAKHHAREVLEAAGYQIDRPEDVSNEDHETRVLAGHKAAVHNPNVSAAAKEHAREYLKEHGQKM